ncbi:MAG: DUF6798 domain-containing protein [Microcoleaceae cyanobacterium]
MIVWQNIKSIGLTLLKILGLGILFGLAYVQQPLYTSNQNTKFLQGMAEAGYGYLDQDWLANTLDPLPVFTAIVQLTQTSFISEFFYIYYWILFGIYIYSLIGIAAIIFDLKSYTQKLIYFVLLVVIHCLKINIFDFETQIHLHYGVAKQYILGSYFQTSNFGVFIILSIYLFLSKKYTASIISLAIAATVHPTYLPSAAILTLSYLLIRYQNKDKLTHIIPMGLLSLTLVLPVVVYMTLNFPDTSPEIAEQARTLLISRIPHHSLPQIWLNSVAWIQILVIILAIYLVRKTQIYLILFIPFGLAALLTGSQFLTENKTLAFLTPWRVSAFLMPVATSLILAVFVRILFHQYHLFFSRYRRIINLVFLTILVVFVIVGISHQLKELNRSHSHDSVMAFVKQNKTESDLYLVPHTSGNFIPFRLQTGAPILINQKSHPYKDTEVLEWHNRLMMAQQFYGPEFRPTRCQTLEQIVTFYQVTHVILEQGDRLECRGWDNIYGDERYRVYQRISQLNRSQSLGAGDSFNLK